MLVEEKTYYVVVSYGKDNSITYLSSLPFGKTYFSKNINDAIRFSDVVFAEKYLWNYPFCKVKKVTLNVMLED